MALQLMLLHRNQKTSSSSSPLLLLLLLWLTTTSAALSLAKAGCQEECGNVTIPYPFGIGAGCHFDERYSVECRNNNSTPYFKSINLEVLGISVYSRIVLVNNPVIISLNCPVVNNNNRSSNTSLVNGVDLRSSPFLISITGNFFVAVMGCNKHAVMTDLYNNSIAECSTPGCNSNPTKNISSCKAYNQLDDSQSLQGYNATFTNTTSGSGEQSPCTYAFLLRNGYNATDYSMAVQNGTTTHVPILLRWTLNGWVPKEDKYNSTTCYNFSNTISSSNGSSSVIEIFQCYCKFSDGNPYLPNGCIGTYTTHSTTHLYVYAANQEWTRWWLIVRPPPTKF